MAKLQPIFGVNFSGVGVAVDATFDIGLPQLELGSVATSPIKTSGSAVTRAAETLTIAGLGAVGFADGDAFVSALVYDDATSSTVSGTVASGGAALAGSQSKPIKSLSAPIPPPHDIPLFASFPILTEQAANGAAVDSAWAPLLGANGTITWSGDRNVQFADDAAGTNATAGATSGSHVHNNTARKYIRTSAIKSTSGRATTSSNVTLNGQVRPFYTITAAVTAYPTVNNGGAAVSRWDKTGTLSGICKGIIARRTLINAAVNNEVIVGGKTTSAFQNNYVTSGVQERLTLISSTAHAARFDMGSQPTGQWLDDLIMFDWTKDPSVDGQDAVCQMVRNFQRKTLNATGTTLNTIGGTRTTDLTGIFGGSAPMGLGVFGLNNGTLPCNRQAEWFWFYFETNAATPLPDITDPFVAAKFGADNFGASGNAGGALPTPHLFFHAASAGAAEWNAGLPNLGSLGGTLGRVTGTYT